MTSSFAAVIITKGLCHLEQLAISNPYMFMREIFLLAVHFGGFGGGGVWRSESDKSNLRHILYGLICVFLPVVCYQSWFSSMVDNESVQ